MELERLLEHALVNPDDALLDLDRLDAEDSLLDFIKLTWPILEPRREFIDGWAVHAICEHLEAVSAGEITKLLINVPPGCMKSLTTNVFWPAWEWGPRDHPEIRYVGASYSQDLTIRDNRRCRNIITSDLYQRLWGDRFRLMEDQNAKVKFETDKTGFKIATSVGGVGTGERGDRFIIDDPHNVKDAESDTKRESALQWFTEVVPTRVTDPDNSAIIVIMQRVHERDVSGLILASELGYDHLMLPMEYEEDHPYRTRTVIDFQDPREEEGELLWPDRFSADYLEGTLKPALRAWGGTYAEAGQLQQRPAPRGGGLFKRDWFQFLESPPAQVSRRVRGWDLAATANAGSYTAGVKMSMTYEGNVVIEDVVRGQLSPGQVENLILTCAKNDGHETGIDIPQDPGQAGKAQRMHLIRKLHGYDARSTPETGSKEDRALPLAAQAESGNLYLVRAPWNDQFIAEATMFPAGRYKDQVDGSSRSYARLIRKREKGGVVAPQVIG